MSPDYQRILREAMQSDGQSDSGWFNWVKRLWPWKRKMALPPNAQAGDWVPEAGDWVAVQIDGKFVADILVKPNANWDETLIAARSVPGLFRVLGDRTTIHKKPVVIPGKLVNFLTD